MISATVYTILGFLLAYAGWKIYEGLRDRKLFHHQSEKHFSKNLSAARALGLFKNTSDIVAIDVRPASQYNEEHLPNALNASYVKGELNSSAIDGIDRSTPILIYCAGGHRSRFALPALKSMGFERIYHLNRGLMAWKLFRGPTSKDIHAEE